MCANRIRADGIELSDGRVVCQRCHRTGLNTHEEVEELRLKVLLTMKAFGMDLKQPAPLKVVDAVEMATVSGHAWQPTHHHDARTMGVYGVSHYDEMLLVESGQPPEMLVWTLAHESAHDWHADSNPVFQALDEEIQEGFAQWAADEVARRLGYSEVAKRQLSREDVYGLAPKQFLRLEFIAGIEEVLAFAKTSGWGRSDCPCLADLQDRNGREQRARDLSFDADFFTQRGHVFASAMCLGLALRATPSHAELRGRWIRRHARNLRLLLTLRAGTIRAAATAWMVVLIPILLFFGACYVSQL
jgi:hypothetical protein